MSRGGPQVIPRPPGAVAGAAAPWSAIDVSRLELTVDAVEAAMAGRGHLDDDVVVVENTSAVLAPIFDSGRGATAVLIRRAAHMRTHAHQVAFPGGRVDPSDGTILNAAIREAQEEIDLDPHLVSHVGWLDPFLTGESNSLVHPAVVRLPYEPELTPAPDEVEKILMVPLADLLEPNVFREEIWLWEGNEYDVSFFEIEGDTIWGATARMLRQLLTLTLAIDDPLRPRLSND